MRNILLIIGVFASAFSIAQDSDTTSYVFNSTYVAKIEKAEKISDNPEVVDTIKTETDIQYEVITRHVNTEFKPKTIPPVKLTLNPTRKSLNKHNASIGFGVGGFPKLSYGYNSGRNADQAFGVMVNHYSAKTSIEDYDRNNAFMKNDFDLVYKKFVSHYVFTGDLNYSYDFFNLYGISNELASDSGFFVNNDNQTYALGRLNLAYHTGYKDSSALNHYGGLSYQNLFDKAMNMEHAGFVNAGIIKYLEKGLLDVNLDAQYYLNQDSSGTSNYGSVFNLTPTHKWRKDKFEFLLGLVLSGDLSQAGSKVNVTPRIKGQYGIVDDLLNVYVDVNGGHSRWSYARLSQLNPFIDIANGFINTRTAYNARAGFRGSLSKTMTFNLGLRLQDVKNQALFVNNVDLGSQNQFKVIYDDITQTQFYGELTHEGDKWINSLQGEYNVFSAESQVAVWHMPEYKFVWITNYNVQDLLAVSMDAYLIGSRQALTYTDDLVAQNTELSPFFDLNLSIDYNYSENLVAFVNGYNLLNNNYMYWNGYPVQGINFLIGAKYRF